MDFDEWMAKNYSSAFDMPHPREAYKAGQQSKQAEIDALKAELAKHNTLDLEPADIPHGCIVLEK